VEIGGGEGRVLESRFGVRGASRGAGITRTGMVTLDTIHSTRTRQLQLASNLSSNIIIFFSFWPDAITKPILFEPLITVSQALLGWSKVQVQHSSRPLLAFNQVGEKVRHRFGY
jgi:hypothetical protein